MVWTRCEQWVSCLSEWCKLDVPCMLLRVGASFYVHRARLCLFAVLATGAYYSFPSCKVDCSYFSASNETLALVAHDTINELGLASSTLDSVLAVLCTAANPGDSRAHAVGARSVAFSE